MSEKRWGAGSLPRPVPAGKWFGGRDGLWSPTQVSASHSPHPSGRPAALGPAWTLPRFSPLPLGFLSRPGCCTFSSPNSSVQSSLRVPLALLHLHPTPRRSLPVSQLSTPSTGAVCQIHTPTTSGLVSISLALHAFPCALDFPSRRYRKSSQDSPLAPVTYSFHLIFECLQNQQRSSFVELRLQISGWWWRMVGDKGKTTKKNVHNRSVISRW